MWPLAGPPREVWLHAGVVCAIAWGFAGYNGYVQLPPRHPWRMRDYDEIPVEVHGGLTFGHHRSIENREFGLRREGRTAADTGGWVGFDTMHAWDHWPDDELPMPAQRINRETVMYRQLMREMHTGDRFTVTWTLERLRAEVEHLAEQIGQVPPDRPAEWAKRRRLATTLRQRERRARRHQRSRA